MKNLFKKWIIGKRKCLSSAAEIYKPLSSPVPSGNSVRIVWEPFSSFPTPPPPIALDRSNVLLLVFVSKSNTSVPVPQPLIQSFTSRRISVQKMSSHKLLGTV